MIYNGERKTSQSRRKCDLCIDAKKKKPKGIATKSDDDVDKGSTGSSKAD